MSSAPIDHDAPHALDQDPSRARLESVIAVPERPAPPGVLTCCAAFGWRSLLKFKHIPEQAVDIVAFPVVMTLLFTFLFGGAIAGSSEEYIQFLLPGSMVMPVLMVTMYTGTSINADMTKGIFDRVRTLPIWRPSPVVGYLLSDVLRYALASVVVLMLGFLVGFRPEGGVTGVLGAIGLLIAFSFAVSWVWTAFGLVARDERSVQGLTMLTLFPLCFLSNIIVPPHTMPAWLQAFVEVNPVTHRTTAVRSLMGGAPDTGAILLVLALAAGVTTVFGTLSTWLYNRR